MDMTLLLAFISLLLLHIVSSDLQIAKWVQPKRYNTSHAEDCSDKVLFLREGNISSPNYPNRYPNRISCRWRIFGDVGDVITIRLLDLNIEESGICEDYPCCIYNWLKIGTVVNGSEKIFCGQDEHFYQSTFVSLTNKVLIKFHISSVRNYGRGFHLSYSIGPKKSLPCRNDYFQCNSGSCIPSNARCNGVNDCNDGSDEAHCSAFCLTGRSCQSFLFCYDEKKHCDGVIDCTDFSDELGCGPCTINETSCSENSNQCYNPFTQRCNRIKDCFNGVDEQNCVQSCPGKLSCASSIGCYLPEERCNGIAQCSDSSDEKNCGPDLCNYDRGGFLCGNGHCIREMWKCDHTNDCGDGSDEYYCLRNSVLTAAIMGSLICALLLIISISCTCRLYALRALENQMTNRENSMSRLSPEFVFPEPPPSYAVAVGENHRNLCIENIHYNPGPPRRNRHRLRRSRRHLDSRRGSILDPALATPGSPYNFPFPCLPVVLPTSPEILQPIPTISNESQEVRTSCPTVDDTVETAEKDQRTEGSNAESSFSEPSSDQKKTDNESTTNTAIHVISNEIISENDLTNNHCDSDVQPLII